ncbi:DNA repair protein RecN [Actinomyces wuliandei]|uniref:DNA repair protein RecN n=1 Tax=Actinomyces wuliandei TaxID=2057743 RepID=UPI001118C81C|nr:DNA repair protein RecN [Actinomyces wuliandei]
MIDSLRIEDLGVIQEAEMTLSKGLTALTGETGAGKTMVLTSLGLLLGQRAETSVVRAGARRCLVEGTFLVEPASRAAARAVEAGAELDGEVLIASRTVPASGRSRAYLGGRSVPSAVLAEVGSTLVAVHGQTDQLRLRSAATQRAALDSLGGSGHAQVCRRYSQAYRHRKEAAEALASWQASAQDRAQEAARLRTWLNQIDELDPQPGEDHRLREEAERLDNAEDLRRAAEMALVSLSGREESLEEPADVVTLAARADRALAAVADVDPALADLAERTRRLGIEAADVSADLAGYLEDLEADPARLAWVQDRRAALARGCQEIGGAAEYLEDVDALLAWQQQAVQRLCELDGPGDTESLLARRLAEADDALSAACSELSRGRAALARRLEEAVTGELDGLQMAGSRLVVELTALDQPGPAGAESVAFLLVSHPGAPALPLGKGASGGELSRIMLALEVVLAEAQPQDRNPAGGSARARTLVFDEIDAGVGGRAAREVGRRLARLSRLHQVVVVTHLAQVAAWADTHLVVRRQTAAPTGHAGALAGDGAPDTASAQPDTAAQTLTTVTAVEGRQRQRELARMLSGHEDSQAAVRHAAELLREATVAQSQA